ncbi:17-beta-hydroxysteroid dehydrogenase type 6-like [Physella acuta]|uniref:17-beta-hydroxysteroid dehydrogenase type 6-like n=1 Tax=Physella acuta TaxID=109671 RepID=UPI0027DC62D9|nr:17-beta-hydroxysteroid dehydrogenase type 6-like [Physella acuta]XP_059166194.1 17-beta-hydroxysteroid dehydrogenase type 6-like [Physella acuta]XP_059166195.1 17-beta-hydroxysteroid dehydrogenase type 6-like [Physella acuta]
MMCLCSCLFSGIAFVVISYYFLDWVLRLFKVGQFSEKYVFITGCDSGFGKDLAIRLDKLGFHVFAGCLTDDGCQFLSSSCSNNLFALKVDVTKSDSIESAYNTVKFKLPSNNALWAVVNNAGIAGPTAVVEMFTRKEVINTCEVNLFGPIEVAQTFLPLLRQSKGRLVNMVSVMGRCPAVSAPYSVSKFGMEAFTDVIRREVSDFGVDVIAIEPGFFRTTILDESRFFASIKDSHEKAPEEVRQAYGATYVEDCCKIIKGVVANSSPDTYKVVDAYIHAITSKYPRCRYLVGFDAKFIFVPLYLLPEKIMDWIMKFQEKRLLSNGERLA